MAPSPSDPVRIVDIAQSVLAEIANAVVAALGAAGATLPSVTETTGTYTYDESNAGQQTLATIAIATRSKVNSIWIDLVNATENTTVRVFHQIDGTNYREFQSNLWTTGDNDGVLVEGFTAYRNIRITLQCDGTGAGNVNVSYAVV